MNRTAYIETNDLSLAAGLLALGIPPHDELPFVKTKTSSGEQYRFLFQETSICGKYDCNRMMQEWNNDNFHVENPDHPFAYIKCAFKNRNGLLDVVKQANELIIIEKNGKLAIISKNASEELQQKIFSQL
jgi:hypothetical protein